VLYIFELDIYSVSLATQHWYVVLFASGIAFSGCVFVVHYLWNKSAQEKRPISYIFQLKHLGFGIILLVAHLPHKEQSVLSPLRSLPR